MPPTIEIGCRAKDRVTGFEGVITARVQYLTSEPQARLEANTSSGLQSAWFDETRLNVTATKDEVSAALEQSAAPPQQ